MTLRVASHSPSYHSIRLLLEAKFTTLEREKIVHWLLHFRNEGVNIDDCRGRTITTGGAIEFEGSARNVFWSFIKPCLQDVIEEVAMLADTRARDLAPRDARIALGEVRELLKAFIDKVYLRMSDVDRAMRGGGSPNSVPAFDPRDLISDLHLEIDERVDALLRHYPIGWNRVKAYVSKNPYGVVVSLIVPFVLAVLGAALHYMFSKI